MKKKVRINIEGKYVKSVNHPKSKINLGKALIKGLNKKGNTIWNNLLLSLQAR